MTLEEYVNLHRGESSPMGGLNNVKVDTIIFTHDRDKAERKMTEVYNECPSRVYRFIKSSYAIALHFYDGSRYMWLNPTSSARGYRCRKAIIDRNITLLEFQDHLDIPCMYCGKDDISFF